MCHERHKPCCFQAHGFATCVGPTDQQDMLLMNDYLERLNEGNAVKDTLLKKEENINILKNQESANKGKNNEDKASQNIVNL